MSKNNFDNLNNECNFSSIIYIKSLFCPNQSYFNKTYHSIINNLNYFLQFRINIKIVLIGWIEDKFRNKIQNLVNGTKFDIEFIPWNKNYGKITLYHDFNYLAKNYNYIMYCDHDILFDLEKTNLDNILINLNNLFVNNNFTFLAFNQIEDCRHQPTLLENMEIIDQIKIFVSKYDNEIGGGCFIIKNIKMKEPNFNYVYGFDEKYLMSCMTNKKCGVLGDYYVVHPYNSDDEKYKYNEWKKNNIMQKINKLFYNDKKDYNEEIEKSHLFWESLPEVHL